MPKPKRRFVEATIVICVSTKGKVWGKVVQGEPAVRKAVQEYTGQGRELYLYPVRVGVPEGLEVVDWRLGPSKKQRKEKPNGGAGGPNAK